MSHEGPQLTGSRGQISARQGAWGTLPGLKGTLLCPCPLQHLGTEMRALNIAINGEFLGGPVGRTLNFDCCGPGFDLWSGN